MTANSVVHNSLGIWRIRYMAHAALALPVDRRRFGGHRRMAGLATQLAGWTFLIVSTLQIGAVIYDGLWSSLSQVHPLLQLTSQSDLDWTVDPLLYGSLALLLMATGWFAPPRARRWAVVAGTCGLAAIFSAVLSRTPLLLTDLFHRGAGFTAQVPHRWFDWNWFQLVVVFTGMVFTIAALSTAQPDAAGAAIYTTGDKA